MTTADDFVSEAEVLADQLEDYDIEQSSHSGSWSSMVRHETKKDKRQYEKNKKAKVGTKLICAGPTCSNTFIKKHYQQAFCCTKHKNQYWNRQRKDMSDKQQLIDHCSKVIDNSRDLRKLREHAVLYHLLNGVSLSEIFDEDGNLYDDRHTKE